MGICTDRFDLRCREPDPAYWHAYDRWLSERFPEEEPDEVVGGMVRDWRNGYDYLTDDEKDELMRHLSDPAYAVDSARVASMDRFYHITKESCMD